MEGIIQLKARLQRENNKGQLAIMGTIIKIKQPQQIPYLRRVTVIGVLSPFFNWWFINQCGRILSIAIIFLRFLLHQNGQVKPMEIVILKLRRWQPTLVLLASIFIVYFNQDAYYQIYESEPNQVGNKPLGALFHHAWC